MGAYPGVGAYPGHYGTSIIMIMCKSSVMGLARNSNIFPAYDHPNIIISLFTDITNVKAGSQYDATLTQRDAGCGVNYAGINAGSG